MVFMLSDSEEHIFNKVKETIRNESAIEYIEEISEPILTFQGLKIYTRKGTVSLNGNTVKLNRQEFLALCYLAEHPGWICTKEQIYGAVYCDEKTEDVTNSVYCLIHGLRKKLETDSRHPKYIQTVRGLGYRFVIPEE